MREHRTLETGSIHPTHCHCHHTFDGKSITKEQSSKWNMLPRLWGSRHWIVSAQKLFIQWILFLFRSLVKDPRINLVSFTGSTEVGRIVGQHVQSRFGKVSSKAHQWPNKPD
jgi:hypothetical protein